MIHRRISLWHAALLAVLGAHRTTTQPAAPPGPADGYEDCNGGIVALSVRIADARTGRGVPMGVLGGIRVGWRAGQSAGTGYFAPNFGPGRGMPTTGTADGLRIPTVFGRPGTYDLTVRVAGYRLWRAQGVQVLQGATHCSAAREVVVDARLRPELRRMR